MSRVTWRIAAGVAALSLVVAALVGVAGAAAAPITDQSVMSSLYFPWIPNGETLDGAGPWYGAVSLQNLENAPVDVAFNSTTNTVTIPAQGTVSLSAGTLGIAAPGGQLVTTASWDPSSLPTAICTPAGTTTQTVSTTQTVTHTTQNGADTITLPSNETFKDVTSVTYGSTTYVVNQDYKVVTTTNQIFNVDWSLGGNQPPTNATYSVNFEYTVTVATPPDCTRAPEVAGAEKQSQPTAPNNLVTSDSQSAVDGYTALDASQAASTIYLPIVQLNNGWDSIIHVSNPTTTNTNVSLMLTVAGNLTSGGNVSQTVPVAAGTTAVVDLATLVPSGWVGSAMLTASSGNIVALVDRVKPTTQMALINVAQPAATANTSAALVFRNYQNWMTGINLSNTSNAANTVTINYYNPDGSVLTTDTVTLPANGMEFVYLPDQAATAPFAGAATLSGQAPFLVALDEVKYTTNLEAMSYLATDQGAAAVTGDMLALPIVQKGDPNTGLGDTSGLNLFNPSTSSVNVNVTYYDLNGNTVSTTSVTLVSHQSYTLYTLSQADLPTGFQGSAVVSVMSGSGSVVAVSNNVNYAVPGDGSSVYSLELITPPLS